MTDSCGFLWYNTEKSGKAELPEREEPESSLGI